MASTTQQRRRHTETESGYASLIGAGLLFMMLAFGLSAVFGGAADSSERFNLFLIGGALAFIAFSVMWAFHLRPWRHFDDWSTPLYTGHESHGAHDEHAEDESHTQVAPSMEAEAHLMASTGHEAVAYSQVVPSAEAEAKFASQETPAAVTDALESAGAVEEDPSDLAAVASIPTGKLTQTAEAGYKDNLQVIEGIGPKIAEALHNAGVQTFAQLAAKQPADLEKIVRDAGVRMVGHGETWPEQAQLAAEGKFEELKTLQEKLSGGRH
ncbi:MAG: hypothetical protein KF716_12175 [Anaerolineae bacterium]|nr:hypothetical protein [Anaerolineae bacterium]